jgi:TetR/AcrR family transcriptional regulator of autoinduction and epiphytic fitness
VASPTAAVPVDVDGRRARREQNRSAVLDALIELHQEGVYEPSSAQIAQRAGLSPRSLFRYFDDVDDLNRAAIESQLARARPLLAVAAGPEDPTDNKVERVVHARLRLYEAIAPAARAARVCAWRHTVVADQIVQSRDYLRHQLKRLFAPELRAMGTSAAAARLAAIDVLCSFETWELLRADRRRATLAEALTALLRP